jgi:hypothetical protein
VDATQIRQLMTHLAQFGAFSLQAEVLCTRGLEYLLENDVVRKKFAALILECVVSRSTVALPDDLKWRAEVRQWDGARPDLEATCGERPVVKVEAKLGAPLAVPQVRSYADDLAARNGSGIVVILVPAYRRKHAHKIAAELCKEQTACPVAVAVTSWEEVVSKLGDDLVEPFGSDLAQFAAMYGALIAAEGKKITGEPDTEGNAEVWETVIDSATRRLAEGGRLLPLGTENTAGYYRRRYICRRLGDKSPCFSVGLHAPLNEQTTHVWLRFTRSTPMFSVISDRLMVSPLSPRVVHDEHGLWFPIDVPTDVTAHEVIDAIVAQAEEVAQIAYAPLN